MLSIITAPMYKNTDFKIKKKKTGTCFISNNKGGFKEKSSSNPWQLLYFSAGAPWALRPLLSATHRRFFAHPWERVGSRCRRGHSPAGRAAYGQAHQGGTRTPCSLLTRKPDVSSSKGNLRQHDLDSNCSGPYLFFFLF